MRQSLCLSLYFTLHIFAIYILSYCFFTLYFLRSPYTSFCLYILFTFWEESWNIFNDQGCWPLNPHLIKSPDSSWRSTFNSSTFSHGITFMRSKDQGVRWPDTFMGSMMVAHLTAHKVDLHPNLQELRKISWRRRHRDQLLETWRLHLPSFSYNHSLP